MVVNPWQTFYVNVIWYILIFVIKGICFIDFSVSSSCYTCFPPELSFNLYKILLQELYDSKTFYFTLKYLKVRCYLRKANVFVQTIFSPSFFWHSNSFRQGMALSCFLIVLHCFCEGMTSISLWWYGIVLFRNSMVLFF